MVHSPLSAHAAAEGRMEHVLVHQDYVAGIGRDDMTG
jgi:hypothetical protein